VEVAVVGAGFTGLASAWHLARNGHRVAVLDAGSLATEKANPAASLRTGGLVLEGTAADPLAGVEACIPSLQRLLQETEITCELQLTGCRELMHRGRPEAPGWRDGDAWLCTDAVVPGGTLDPGRLWNGLVGAARRAGASLHPGVRVHRVAPGAAAPLDLGGAVLACDAVVLATGAFTGILDPGAPDLRVALTLALSTGPLDEAAWSATAGSDARPFYTLDLPYLWGRPARGRRWIFGAGLLSTAPRQLADLTLGSAPVARACEMLIARVRALHPALADVAIERRWAGPVAFRGDGIPVVSHHPADPRFVLATAFAGHGVALSVRAAELLTAAVTSGAALPDCLRLDPEIAQRIDDAADRRRDRGM